MKKLVSLLLAILMVCVTLSALAYSPEDPITIEFWHTRGSGAQYKAMKGSVDRFNETVGKEKGIIVSEQFQGSYAQNVTAIELASQSNSQPAVGVTSSAQTAQLLDDGLAADMAPYMAETGFDLSRFIDALLDVPAIHDGEVRTVPYIRSVPIFVYNKDMADAKGLTEPKTIAEMEEFCKALWVTDEKGEVVTYGFEMWSDASFIQGALLWSTGAPLLKVDEETGRRSSPCLDEGSLLRLLTDWDRWISEGWCRPFDSSNGNTNCQQRFYQGKVASYIGSCGGLGNFTKNAKEAGITLGVCNVPYYDEPAVGIGGGNLILVENDNEEIKRAGWEFIQFLLSDDEVATEATISGYLPTLKDIGSNKIMADFWAENPQYIIGYNELPFGHCNEVPYFPERMEFVASLTSAFSQLIQERSLTPQEAVDQVKLETAHLFD